MTILNGLGLVPLFMGIGTSIVLVSVAAEGAGNNPMVGMSVAVAVATLKQ